MPTQRPALAGLLTAILVISLVSTLPLPVASGDETFSFSFSGEDSGEKNTTLAPGERHIFHIRFVYPDTIMDRTRIPKTFFYFVRSNNNASFSYHTVWGFVNSTSGHIPSNSTEHNNSMFYGYFDLKEREKLTVILEATGNETLDYYLVFYAKESEERPREKAISYGLTGILILGAIGAAIVIIRSPRYRESMRTVRHSPQDLVRQWRASIPKYDSRLQTTGSFVSKRKKYISAIGDGSTCCPHCREPIGKPGNRYQFNGLTFVDQVLLPDGSGNVRNRYWLALGVYCEKCERLLGIVRK